ncbi:hypothetical protein [Paenibacillus sp. NFR01]|uniref:hypothetical protein n=1 Tax=Paenibacillus sp. NFR01 TaxID=1566279 RepID=UPI0008B353C5|nr:hypothetical protein [Paenibacillus sp. NFR01]SEU08716.1 hypothetical protein SAMN03159358_3222 [Paenibacillus sp. NFR01]
MTWLKRGLVVCLIVVLASGLSVLTTAYVVNTYIQSALASFDIELDGAKPGLGGFIDLLTGKDSKTTSDATKAPEATPKPSEAPAGEKVPEDSLAVMGQASDAEEQSQDLVMTPGAMSSMKDNLGTDEKSNIFNILMTKVPAEEMQKISAAMENGLTESEVMDIQQIIAKYVSDEEYDSLMKMLTPDKTSEP